MLRAGGGESGGGGGRRGQWRAARPRHLRARQRKTPATQADHPHHQIFAYSGSTPKRHALNPVSPNSDQHQFSATNIRMLPREMVMRVNKMITKEKMLRSVIKFSQLIL